MYKKYRENRSLFITYDGLLDPLGASQIIPYVRAIGIQEEQLYILSFEKPERFRKCADQLRRELEGTSIVWTPLIFTRSGGILGKLWDLMRMHASAVLIAFRLRPSVVHARGHAPAHVGLLLKQLFSARLLFDFRGLWVDERVDKGGWNLNNPWHELQFRYYKRVERKILNQADHVVVLTEAVVPEVIRLGVPSHDRITVIPCCADFSHFLLANAEARKQARRQLGLSQTSLVLGYLGSAGGMYLPERFLQFVAQVNYKVPKLEVLVLTPDHKDFLRLIHSKMSSQTNPTIHVCTATRAEVAQWLPSMDLLVSFIKPTYARIGSSPTKLAEAWASGIPTLCNTGVGDVSQLVTELDAGMVIDVNSDQELQASIEALPAMISKGGLRLRSVAEAKLSLHIASERYLAIYRLLRS